MAKKSNRKITYVEERLQDLHALKDVHGLQSSAKNWKRKANMKEVTKPGSNDFRTQVSAIVKMQKDADLLSAMPEFSFKPLNEKGRKNRKIVKHAWDYHWLISNTDKSISEVVQSSTTFGTGVLYEGIKHQFKIENRPYMNENGKIEFKETEKLTYSGIETKKIPFENFFINGTDIENSTEACVISYYDKEQYVNDRSLDPNYKNLNKVKSTEMPSTTVQGTVGDQFSETTLDRVVVEIQYWNIAKDEYIVVANGVEVKKTPNPYPHKELPFSLYIGDKAEDRIWGIGVFELLEQEERYKNELRTLLVQGVRYSIGLILKDRNADIEEGELIAGLGQTAETDDMNGLKHIALPVPVAEIGQVERAVSDDIIAKSGVDYRSQYSTEEKLAEGIRAKAKSSKKRINKNIKDNAYSFFSRMAFLRMANIQFLHSIKEKEIPIEGGSIKANGVFEKDETGGVGSAIINKELISGEYLVLPITETMIGDNKSRRREDVKEWGELVSGLVNDDGSRVYKGAQVGQVITEEWGYDHEKLSQAGGSIGNPQEKLRNFKMQMDGTRGTEVDPSYVGPNQRSEKGVIPTLSGRSKSIPNEE